MQRGWIKSYKKKLDWEWFTEPLTAHLFDYLLHAVNYEDKTYRGEAIMAGQLVTSYDKLSTKTGMSVQSVRTALKNLELTNDITRQSTRQGTKITVNNWLRHQGSCEEGEGFTVGANKQSTHQLTDNQHTNQHTNQQTTNTPINNYLRSKEVKKLRSKEVSTGQSASEVDRETGANPKNKKPKRTKYEGLFIDFWEAYPKKSGKAAAYKAFQRIGVDDELLAEIFEAIEWQKKSRKWKEGYIPNPATYLNREEWLDEPEEEEERFNKWRTSDSPRKIELWDEKTAVLPF